MTALIHSSASGQVLRRKDFPVGFSQNLFGLDAQDLFRRFVDGADRSFPIQRNDPGADVPEHDLHVTPSLLQLDVALAEFGVRLFHLDPAALEVLGHLVEGIDQGPELVLRGLADLEIQVAPDDLLGSFGQLLDRVGNPFGESKAKPDGRKNN